MELFDYDPLTGITTWFDYDDDTDTAIFRREEDISGVLRVAELPRQQQPGSYIGQSDEKWFPQAIIPATVMAELMKKGIDVAAMEGRDASKLAKAVEQDYSYLKLTDKKIWRPT